MRNTSTNAKDYRAHFRHANGVYVSKKSLRKFAIHWAATHTNLAIDPKLSTKALQVWLTTNTGIMFKEIDSSQFKLVEVLHRSHRKRLEVLHALAPYVDESYEPIYWFITRNGHTTKGYRYGFFRDRQYYEQPIWKRTDHFGLDIEIDASQEDDIYTLADDLLHNYEHVYIVNDEGRLSFNHLILLVEDVEVIFNFDEHQIDLYGYSQTGYIDEIVDLVYNHFNK